MSRYFFHVHDGVSIPDTEGVELATLTDARREAVRLSGEILSETGDHFWIDGEWRMDITDDTGLVLFALSFSAIEGAGGRSTAADEIAAAKRQNG